MKLLSCSACAPTSPAMGATADVSACWVPGTQGKQGSSSPKCRVSRRQGLPTCGRSPHHQHSAPLSPMCGGVGPGSAAGGATLPSSKAPGWCSPSGWAREGIALTEPFLGLVAILPKIVCVFKHLCLYCRANTSNEIPSQMDILSRRIV